MSDDRNEERGLNIATRVLGALLGAGALGIVVALILHRAPDNALVLATRGDCVRSFDDATCREIVAAAFKIHAQSAPRFATSGLCELSFGEGGCRPSDADAGPLSFFVPSIAVILATREGRNNVTAVVPLYAGPANRSSASDGAASIFYRGRAVGTFQSRKFGGADISIVLDTAGKPMTGESVRTLASN